VAVYFAARLGTCLILGVGLFLYLSWFVAGLSVVKIWQFTIGGALLGYLLPTFYLSRRVKKRTERNRQGFPDFMDLMVVCSEAGLSMEAAIDRIAREMVETCPSLAENLYMVSLEIRAGKSFVEALERMGQRLGIAEATTLATLLQQSSELGSSLTQSLRICSDEMRNKRLSKAEEKAYALPAKLVVPLTLFVFPVLLITLMLPVVVRVSAMMG
jgi:tight adherence protein C